MHFTFKKEETFKTGVGKFFTLVTVGLMISFVTMRLLKLVIKNDPLVSMIEMDSTEIEIDLFELDYMFAI